MVLAVPLWGLVGVVRAPAAWARVPRWVALGGTSIVCRRAWFSCAAGEYGSRHRFGGGGGESWGVRGRGVVLARCWVLRDRAPSPLGRVCAVGRGAGLGRSGLGPWVFPYPCPGRVVVRGLRVCVVGAVARGGPGRMLRTVQWTRASLWLLSF